LGDRALGIALDVCLESRDPTARANAAASRVVLTSVVMVTGLLAVVGAAL
jgi:hypothetical protein